MRCRGTVPTLFLLIAWMFSGAPAADASTQVWEVESGFVTLSLTDQRLELLGLSVVDSRTTSLAPEARREVVQMLEPPLYSLAMPSGFDFEVKTRNGHFAGFVNGVGQIPVEGGLTFQTSDPVSGVRLAPAFLYDFVVEIDPSAPSPTFARIRTTDPSLPVPLEIQNAGIQVDQQNGEFNVRMGDVVITEEWADLLGRPRLAGKSIGMFDLRLTAQLVRGVVTDPERQDGPGGGATLDVKLGELYGLQTWNRTGAYPNGLNGLSAATTSCNVGDVRVPWHSPMDPEHPFITLALFRQTDYPGTSESILEMIGVMQMKHGFFALSSSDCDQCTDPTNGDSLGVNCSDTYGASNNASQFYLGPREEIDVYAGTWDPCGSHFDGVNMDCGRSHGSSGHSATEHRLEVYDQDLLTPSADYFYEGLYVVKDDSNPGNDLGWREVNPSWDGAEWDFSHQTPLANGPYLRVWAGPSFREAPVSAGDGTVQLGTKVIDLGGGDFHYEYVLYNRSATQGVGSFSVPIAGNVTDIGFHDYDADAANDWTHSISNGMLTWTANSQEIGFQEACNFRFNTTVDSETGIVSGETYYNSLSFDISNVQVPQAGASGVLAGAQSFEDFVITTAQPNPFADRTEVRFSLARETDVTLSVIDVTGRSVRVLHEGTTAAGITRTVWDGRDASGSRVASGVYFFRLDSASRSTTYKTTLLR